MSYGVLYTKQGCPQAAAMRNLLRETGVSFTEAVIGEDILNEELTSLCPRYNGGSIVAVDGSFVGGYRELVEWAKHRPTYLAG